MVIELAEEGEADGAAAAFTGAPGAATVQRWTRGCKLGQGTSGVVYVAILEAPTEVEAPTATPTATPTAASAAAAGSGLEAARGLACNSTGSSTVLPSSALPWSLAPSQQAEPTAELAAKLVIPRDPEAVAALREEIGLMKRLRHPHVVRYHGCGVRGDEQYILMELCDGGSLGQLIRTSHRKGLPTCALHAFGSQLLSGLHFLHESMIIHRDLKGDNVLLQRLPASEAASGEAGPGGGDGLEMTLSGDPSARLVAKIGDFGSAHELVGDATLDGDVQGMRGSPFWMSPEHINGASCGRKADIWSYGAVLLEMLTGRPPWSAGLDANSGGGHFTLFQILSRITESTGPPPMPPSSEMPRGLHALLLSCFDRDTSTRPSTTELLRHTWVRDGKFL